MTPSLLPLAFLGTNGKHMERIIDIAAVVFVIALSAFMAVSVFL